MLQKVIVTKPATPERTWRNFGEVPGAEKTEVQDAWYLSVPENFPDEKIEEYVKLLERTPDWGNSDELEVFERVMRDYA